MLLPELFVPPARAEDVSYGLSAVSARAPRVQNTRHIPVEEEVLKFDLFGPELIK